MELIRTWILSVTVSAMMIAAAQALMPPGGVRRLGRLTGGLILVLGLLAPLASLDEAALDKALSLPETGEARAQWGDAGYETMEEVIEEELAEYIVEQGQALGVDCGAFVVCRPGEGDIPLPHEVLVRGNLSEEQREALSDWIARELDIPPERQAYESEEGP